MPGAMQPSSALSGKQRPRRSDGIFAGGNHVQSRMAPADANDFLCHSYPAADASHRDASDDGDGGGPAVAAKLVPGLTASTHGMRPEAAAVLLVGAGRYADGPGALRRQPRRLMLTSMALLLTFALMGRASGASISRRACLGGPPAEARAISMAGIGLMRCFIGGAHSCWLALVA